MERKPKNCSFKENKMERKRNNCSFKEDSGTMYLNFQRSFGIAKKFQMKM